METFPPNVLLWEGNEFLELAEASAGIGVWDVDLATGVVRGRPQFFRLMGLDPNTEHVSIEVMRGLRHPDDRAKVVDGFRQSLAVGEDYYEAEYRIVRPDGEIRWILGRGRVTRDVQGEPIRYSGVDIDITDRKDAETRQALLVRELQHRSKNLLAVVQSITSSTLANSNSLKVAHDTILGRLQALARAQEFVATGAGGGVRIDEIVRAELTAFGGRTSVHGPSVLAGAAFAQMFALVVHELATNAIKYGSLSAAGGRVDIRWTMDARVFAFSWKERGGPPVCEPEKAGFGTTLIKAALSTTPSIAYGADGFEYEIEVPSEQVRQA